MGVIWYILGVVSGMLLLIVISCSVVSGRISREEERCGGCVFREECSEDESKCPWRCSDGI